MPLPEDAPKVASEEEFRFGYLVRISEDAVMEGHEAGRYVATHLRYPLIYGPRQPVPCDWWVVRRVLDKRKHVVLPDGGLTVLSRCYAENMANAVLLAADQPNISAGKIYNCGDDHQLTMAQWVQVISEAMGGHLDIVSLPARYSQPARDMMVGFHHSHHLNACALLRQLFQTQRLPQASYTYLAQVHSQLFPIPDLYVRRKYY